MPPPESQRELPERVLGFGDATSIVIGAIIGVGIFFTPSSVAQIAGSSSLALGAWGVAGLIVLAGALSFAELGGMYHGSGAQYDVLRDAYGPLPAFLFVFCNATAIQAGATAIIAVVCASTLNAAVTSEKLPPDKINVLAAGLIGGLVVVNALGVKLGARIQNVTAALKVLALLAVTGLAAFTHAAPPASAPAAPPAHGPVLALCAALVPAFFSYGGWQQALWMSGEVKDPRKNVPRALVVGMAVVVLVYLCVNWAYLRLLGHGGVASSHALAFDAIAVALPSAGGRVVAFAVAVSAYGVLNAQLLAGPRLVFGMARDGRFFSVFAKLGGPAKTPIAAIALIGATALVLLFLAGTDVIGRVLSGVVFVDGIFFVLTGLALLVLRRTRPDAPRPVKVPGYPVVPLVFVLGEVGVVIGAYMNPDARAAAYIGLGWIASGALLYVARFREGGRLAVDDPR